MVDVAEVHDSEFVYGEHTGPAAAVERIRSACADEDHHDPLDEGALLVQTFLPPEASLDTVDRLNHRAEDELREVPEVTEVVRRTGRAERTEDPMPHTVSDVLVLLDPDRTRSRDQIEDEVRERLEHVLHHGKTVHAELDVPGARAVFEGTLDGDRIRGTLRQGGAELPMDAWREGTPPP